MGAQETPAGFRLLGDQPSYDGSDALRFGDVASDLAELVLASRSRTPFTVGVVGDWGSGKSSLMRRLEAQLADVPEVETVWFNAWTAERGEALEGLVKSVLDKLDANILRRAARNKRMMTALRVAVTIGAGVFRLGGIVDTLWERARVDPKARNELRDLLVDAMRIWIQKGPRRHGDRLLVVFVDDLDRCDPDTVFQIFEAMKLYLDAPGLAFVIGFDESVVSEAILEQKRYARSVTGRVYIDKIVQIEVAVPLATDDQMRLLVDEMAEASGTGELLDVDARALIIDSGDRNPRRLKRFINTFVLENRLSRPDRRLQAGALIRTLVVNTYFREFARLSRDGGDPIREFLEYIDVRDAFLDGLDSRDARVKNWLTARGIRSEDVDLPSIEQQLPDFFPRLALNEHFVSLVRSLHDEPTRDDVRSALEERQSQSAASDEGTGEQQTAVESGGETAPQEGSREDDASRPGRAQEPPERRGSEPALIGIHILWLESEPGTRRALVDEIERNGGEVVFVPDLASTRRALARHEVHALVWSVGREGKDDRVFVDLDRLRTERRFAGPVIFFGPWTSDVRKRRARALGATIANEPRVLLFELGRIAGRRAGNFPRGRPPPAPPATSRLLIGHEPKP